MNMHTVLSYLKRQRKNIGLSVLFALIFMIVFYLYQVPVETVVYATGLCMCVGILFFLIEAWRYKKRQGQLEHIKYNILISISGLPKAKDEIEVQYQELIQLLFLAKAQKEMEADQRREESLDYYNLWVHQIKTPISAMDMILQTTKREDTQALSNELFRIENYVEMALNYLRIENISADLKIQTHDLEFLLRQVIRKYAQLFVSKRIKLDFTVKNEQILTDEKWFLFVIEQLIGNAIKYTEAGGTVLVYIDHKVSQTLVIEDTGIGISGEDLPRIFEKGFTGYNGRKDKKATGLGLYLCKETLTKLSHKVMIESEIGKGTTVRVKFDICDLEVE